MNQPTRTLPISEPLLQAIVNVLNTMPAGQVRGILNALEGEVAASAQVQASAQAAPADGAAS